MHFSQLNYVICVAKHLNFTMAAKELYITQPTITHQIQALEKELGVKLFLRTPKKVELTPEGEVFLEDAKKAVSIMEESKKKLLQVNRHPALSLKIAYLSSLSRSYLPYIVEQFRKQYPNIAIEMIRGNAREIIDAAQNSDYDIYCSLTEDLRHILGISLKTILTDHYCLVTNTDHPAISNMSIDYHKLSSEPFILFSPQEGAYLYKQTLDICKQLGFSPRVVKTYTLMEEVLYAVASGIGISFLPYRTKGYVDNNLAYTLLDASNISISGCVAWHTETANPSVDLFLNLFQNIYAEHPKLFM